MEDIEVCGAKCVHEDVIARVKSGLSSDKLLLRASELFKALDDPTRLKIINALLLNKMCVCDIAALMNMSQPAVSHHLKMLKQAHLVRFEREGKVVYYSLDDEHVQNVFYQGLLHASENN
ncbi:MAG: metalloregulator ArsR/SmtB family transcription factor [Treponemataceae bacterium]|nr:MAG: metalloregulator ArsR/SmtB family transcription factor [Treponemataceae bacterium]